MTLKTTFIKASVAQHELHTEINWLATLKPPEKLKPEIDAMVEKRETMLKQIDESVLSISIDVPLEAEKYLPKEEVREPEEPIKPPEEEPIIKDPIEPIGKG